MHILHKSILILLPFLYIKMSPQGVLIYHDEALAELLDERHNKVNLRSTKDDELKVDKAKK